MDRIAIKSEAKLNYRLTVYAEAVRGLGTHLKRLPKVLYMEAPQAEETRMLLGLGYTKDVLHPINNDVGRQAWITINSGVRSPHGNIWKTDWRAFDIVHLDTEHTARRIAKQFPRGYRPTRKQVLIVNCSVHGCSYIDTYELLSGMFDWARVRPKELYRGRYQNGRHGTAPMAYAVFLLKPVRHCGYLNAKPMDA